MIVGVGRVLSVGEATEYAYKVKKPPLRCVLWERNVGHSVRPGFADGFLFPYQEALALAEREGVDPEEFVTFAPDEHFDAYSYGSELLSHDGAVASLVACAATLHRIRGRIEGPWDQGARLDRHAAQPPVEGPAVRSPAWGRRSPRSVTSGDSGTGACSPTRSNSCASARRAAVIRGRSWTP